MKSNLPKEIVIEGLWDDSNGAALFNQLRVEPRDFEIMFTSFRLFGVSFYPNSTRFSAAMADFDSEKAEFTLHPVGPVRLHRAVWWRRAIFWACWPVVWAWRSRR